MTILDFLHGALTAMCVIAGVFFLRYWRISKDTFFIWFACAFWTFALNWLLRAVDPAAPEHMLYIYGIRLAGFLQILVAILLKNRAQSR